MHFSAIEGHKEVVELLIDKYNLSATAKIDVSSSCIVRGKTYPVVVVCGSLIGWRDCCGICSMAGSPSCAETDGQEVWLQCGRQNKGGSGLH